MKILHIASFQGNIGDNASHIGFKNILTELNIDCDVTELEIRKAYNNYTLPDKVNFDLDFAVYANSFDLVVFGGGGFLDYWVDGSVNGTTIGIDYDVLDAIDTPILISSVGSNPHRKVPEGNIAKFKKFLDYVKDSPKITIALRNDNSEASWNSDLGDEYSANVKHILDHGFFYRPRQHLESIYGDERFACLNITQDQISMFNNGNHVKNEEHYYKCLTNIVSYMVDKKELKVVLVPHIYSDIKAIAHLFDVLPEFYRRGYVEVAPMLQGNSGADYLFSLYQHAEFVIGSRYHTNVCSLTMGKPTIGLSPLNRIKHLYDSFGVSDYFHFSYDNFTEGVKQSIDLINRFELDNVSRIIEKKKEKTLEFYRNYFKELR